MSNNGCTREKPSNNAIEQTKGNQSNKVVATWQWSNATKYNVKPKHHNKNTNECKTMQYAELYEMLQYKF